MSSEHVQPVAMPRNTILCGDALKTLRTLPDESVHCVVSSPPYWSLRDYNVAGQIGLEATPDEYVARVVEVFAEVRRVLRSDGTCWVNIGDAYASNWPCNRRNVIGAGSLPNGKREARPPRMGGDLKDKDLIGQPWMIAFALRADGWYLRSEIIWHKSNPMPESVTDRPTKAHETIFLLAKSERYFYDADAIREPVTGGSHPRTAGRNSRMYIDRDPAHLRPGVTPKSARPGSGIKANSSFHAVVNDIVSQRNKRTVWNVATVPYSSAHFATFPPRLIEPCILAGTSPHNCEHCGAPWVRVVDVRYRGRTDAKTARGGAHGNNNMRRKGAEFTGTGSARPYAVRLERDVQTTGWRPSCRCADNTGAAHGIVLDPFFGAGTVGVVCRRHGRDYLGIELNPDYVAMAEARIANERQPMLWTAGVEVGA